MKRPLLLISFLAMSVFAFPGLIAVEEIRSAIAGGDFDSNRYTVIEKPISFSDKRKKLTLDYIRQHYDARARDMTIVPKIIVIHWTVINSAGSAYGYFNREDLQPDRTDIMHGGAVNVSAHYLVDRDGTIYRLMPDTWMARHVIGLNHCAIGIENVGGPAYPLTSEQLNADAWLVVSLVRKYTTIERIIGHHEYLELKKGPLWRALDRKYAAYRKIDPGEKFMKDLRKRLGL